MPNRPSKDLPAPTTTIVPYRRVVSAEQLADDFYRLFPSTTSRGDRDLSYFSALISDFGSELDIDEELKRFHAWTLDRPQGPDLAPRSRFRDWVLRARTFRFQCRVRD